VYRDCCETALVLEMFVHTEGQRVESEPFLCYPGHLQAQIDMNVFQLLKTEMEFLNKIPNPTIVRFGGEAEFEERFFWAK
jgi:hypothetical protein